ncbi:hypothetical protein PV08_09828 [Exophiala spinifera]|uniref:Transcription factor domain-containing protein n=1 Tax=Exophiala spinifera TaxID=91928 RepID=A0A0D1YCD3_9EURO|nr:uncharacterized protein PV08_09828 [Exophiala spinifera]KIW12551.1 hypothetical protein PV08_09828 [Exophiala spinifera]
MSDPSQDIFFLPYDPVRASQRVRQLQNSEARAHAARVAHTRRRLYAPLLFLSTARKPSDNGDADNYSNEKVSGASSKRKNRKPFRRVSAAKLSDHLSPVTILQKGNSDPFDVSAVQISAELNEVLLFYQQNVLPLFVTYMRANFVTISTGKASWHDRFSNLHNVYSACGLLTRTAALMCRLPFAGNRLATQAFTCKAKLLRMLRFHVAREGNRALWLSEATQCIVSLLITAFFEDNLEESTFHLRILREMLYTQSSAGDLDHGFLFTVLWYDFQQASKSLRNPVLDFSVWAADQYRPGWEQALHDLPRLPGCAEKGMNGGVRDSLLKSLFISLREVLEVSSLLASNTAAATPSIKMGIVQWALVCQGQILNLYVDAMSEVPGRLNILRKTPHVLPEDWAPFTKAYTCLAALWWTRRLKREENLPSRPAATILNASKTILSALRLALIHAELFSQGTDSVVNSEVRLWALHVGALAEQHGRTFTGSNEDEEDDNDDHTWFTRSFLLQARSMCLYLWEDVRMILQSFLYADSLVGQIPSMVPV